MLKPLLTAACLCVATIAKAEPVELSGQDIRDLVAGATVEIDTPLGSMPVAYTVNGKLSGQARALTSYLGAATDTGRWWVASDQLCHRWNRWFNAEPQCLRLSKERGAIRWRSQDGNSGTAVIAVPATLQVTALPLGAQTQSKMPIDEPEPSSSLANSFAAAPPAEVAAGMRQPIENKATVAALPAPGAVATYSSQAALEPSPPVVPTYIVANLDRDDTLNVRSGPSTDFDVVGELPPGTRGLTINGACRLLVVPGAA